jgi:hypothetical protein
MYLILFIFSCVIKYNTASYVCDGDQIPDIKYSNNDYDFMCEDNHILLDYEYDSVNEYTAYTLQIEECGINDCEYVNVDYHIYNNAILQIAYEEELHKKYFIEDDKIAYVNKIVITKINSTISWGKYTYTIDPAYVFNNETLFVLDHIWAVIVKHKVPNVKKKNLKANIIHVHDNMYIINILSINRITIHALNIENYTYRISKNEIIKFFPPFTYNDIIKKYNKNSNRKKREVNNIIYSLDKQYPSIQYLFSKYDSNQLKNFENILKIKCEQIKHTKDLLNNLNKKFPNLYTNMYKSHNLKVLNIQDNYVMSIKCYNVTINNFFFAESMCDKYIKVSYNDSKIGYYDPISKEIFSNSNEIFPCKKYVYLVVNKELYYVHSSTNFTMVKINSSDINKLTLYKKYNFSPNVYNFSKYITVEAYNKSIYSIDSDYIFNPNSYIPYSKTTKQNFISDSADISINGLTAIIKAITPDWPAYVKWILLTIVLLLLLTILFLKIK